MVVILAYIWFNSHTHAYEVLDDVDDDHHPQAWAVGVPDSNEDCLSNMKILADEEALPPNRVEVCAAVRVHVVRTSGDGAPRGKAYSSRAFFIRLDTTTLR